MNPDEAKSILAAYREDIPLDEAPNMQAALAAAQEDPSLAAWFEEEQAFDREFAAALQRVPIPEDLEAKLLQGMPATNHAGETPNKKVVAFPQKQVWLAVAALFVIAVSLVKYFAFPPPVEFPGTAFTKVDTFRDHMAHFANQRFVLNHTTKDLSEARDWLRARQSPAYDETPTAIVKFEGMGCKSFDWGGHTVSLVCFKDTNDDIVHLFVINRSALTDLEPATPLEEVLVQQNLETGGWMDDERLYVLVGSEPHVKIGSILKEITG